MRILVVEDEKTLNKNICEYFRLKGYGADRCYDGQEALDYLASAPYDAVILDIMLPVKDVERNIRAMEIDNGKLDIESEFSFATSDTCCLLFSADGKRIDGTYPVGMTECDVPFTDDKLTRLKNGEDGKLVFIYDREVLFDQSEITVDATTGRVIKVESRCALPGEADEPDTAERGEDCVLSVGEAYEAALHALTLDREGTRLLSAQWYTYFGVPVYELELMTAESLYDGVWLRGVLLTDEVKTVWDNVILLMLILLPAFLLFAVVSGVFISKRAMRSVDRLSRTISEISSAQDLTKPVEIRAGDRELQSLTANFNAMSRRLHDAFEAEKQFTSDASHELRTPLSVILSECELQLEKGVDDPDTEQCLHSIREKSLSMRELITRMLDSSRLSRGKERFCFEDGDLSELVTRCAGECRLLCADSRTVESDIEPDIHMNMDERLMESLLMNLLTNAVKYTGDDGRIGVTLHRQGERIVLKVRDNGIGIRPEDREKIFARFYRADKSRSSDNGSIGLGLFLCRQIAQLHDGEIGVESVPNEGSVFTVEF